MNTAFQSLPTYFFMNIIKAIAILYEIVFIIHMIRHFKLIFLYFSLIVFNKSDGGIGGWLEGVDEEH